MKELRLAQISNIEDGNHFLPGFIERFNQRFSVQATRCEDLHRKLNVASSRLDDILCYREQRYVTEQLTLSYDRKDHLGMQQDHSGTRW